MIRLTPTEKAILDDLHKGLSRADIARKRGTGRAAVAHHVKRMLEKGYAVPEPSAHHPIRDTAEAMFRAGKTTTEVSNAMGFSQSRARFLQRKMEERT